MKGDDDPHDDWSKDWGRKQGGKNVHKTFACSFI